MDASALAGLDRNYRLASGEMSAAAERGESTDSSDLHCVTCGYAIAEFDWAFIELPSQAPSHRSVQPSNGLPPAFGTKLMTHRLLDSHGRQGYAEARTWAALEAGRVLGCTVGSLQASEMGRPVYERMGFVETAEYVQFRRG